MGCKSRPKLGCSQLTPDYATGKYLLTLIRIPKSGNQFQKIHSLRIFFDAQFNFTNFFLEFKHHKVQIIAFAILHFKVAF